MAGKQSAPTSNSALPKLDRLPPQRIPPVDWSSAVDSEGNIKSERVATLLEKRHLLYRDLPPRVHARYSDHIKAQSSIAAPGATLDQHLDEAKLSPFAWPPTPVATPPYWILTEEDYTRLRKSLTPSEFSQACKEFLRYCVAESINELLPWDARTLLFACLTAEQEIVVPVPSRIGFLKLKENWSSSLPVRGSTALCKAKLFRRTPHYPLLRVVEAPSKEDILAFHLGNSLTISSTGEKHPPSGCSQGQ